MTVADRIAAALESIAASLHVLAHPAVTVKAGPVTDFPEQASWIEPACDHQRPNRCLVCAPKLDGLTGPQVAEAMTRALIAMRGH